MAKKPLKRREKLLFGALAFVFVCAVAVAVVQEPSTDANGLTVREQLDALEKARQQTEQNFQKLGVERGGEVEKEKDRSVDACVYARNAVKEQLKSPRSADFEGSCNSTTTRLARDRYSVSGYLYAENSFGASLRSFYACTAEFTGETWRVSCEID